ncbi:MAG: hypothetical protein GY722_15405 [bacterium]|nr:hypothetical protein [bacterium]
MKKFGVEWSSDPLTETFPELQSRPNLVEFMRANRKIQRKVLRIAQVLLPLDDALYMLPRASRIIRLAYEDGKRDLVQLESKIPDIRVRAELQGFYRNVHRNVQFRLSDGEKFRKGHKHDIRRRLWR